MVNKPCSRACTRTAVSSRLPSTYRSRSAGSLPNKRRPSQGHNYAQYLFGNNVDESEFIRELQRPAVIQEDLYEMDRRKRVREILQHKEFCAQLENTIRRDRGAKSQESIAIAPPAAQTTLTGLHNIKSSLQVTPVADLTNTNKYTSTERILRNKLACLYRLVDLFQWSQGIYNHITLRLPHKENGQEEILINPFGLLYNEITASSLIKITLDGEVLDSGSTSLGVNQAGYILHSAIHANRPDVKCVLHLHTPVVSAVSSMKCGLLPISQEAMIVGPPAYHDFQGIVCNEQERESIVRDLGDKNIMILRNHGFVACGQSVEDALHLAFHVIIACETQIRAARVGLENINIPDAGAVERAYQTARNGGGGVNRTGNPDAANQWGIGELEWEAWMRSLDSAGFKTGHVYRKPSLKFRMERPSFSSIYLSEIATPPTSSARGRLVEAYSADTMSKCDRLRKQLEKANWLNSPNNYLKTHVLDGNSGSPKTVTKWVSDLTAPHGGTPVKISSVHQFTSLNGSTNEFKEKQRQLNDTRLLGKTTPGPTSQFVDSFLNNDDQSVQESNVEANVIQNRPYIIYTASKGVLDREHQNDGQLHNQYFLQNPFINESDNDIQAYLKEIESKHRSTSAMEQSTFSYNVSPPESPTTRERSKSFEFDAASLMQAVHFNSYNKAPNGDFVEGPIEVPEQRTKRRKGFRTLFSFGKKKK